MSKKQTPQTLLAMAPVKVVETRAPEAPQIAPTLQGSPYEALFRDLPGDPDMKTFVLEQIEISRSWGDVSLRVPASLLIALLDKIKEPK